MTHLDEQAIKDNFHGQYDNQADNGECWLWCGRRDSVGFPVAHLDDIRYPAQRVAYCIGEGIELHDIDPEDVVSPVCFKPLDCVNPTHLRLESYLVKFDKWLSEATAHLRSE